MRPRAWVVALLLASSAREAVAADRKRVAVRVPDATSRALMQRVRGQTSDLDVDLVEATEPVMEAHVGEEVATAGRLGRELDARVVVWFEEGPAGLTLFFSLPEEQRTLVRTLPEAPGKNAPSSATFEAAALVVRSVLRALASGGTIGVTLAAPLDFREREDATPVAAAPKPLPEAREPPAPIPNVEPAPRASREGARTEWKESAALGWHATLIDADTLVQGIEGQGVVSWNGLGVGLQIALDAPAELDDPDASVKLLRLAGGAFVRYTLPLGEHWRTALSVAGGAVGIHRETVSVATGATRAPDAWLASALLGPEIGLWYRGRSRGLTWGVGLRAGADVVFTPPVIGDQVAGAFVGEHALSTVEPKGTLQVEIGSL